MSEKIYGLLGRKLGHSWSVPIHRALGCEPYRLIEIEPEELPAFLRREELGGLNVTIPYKRDVMAYCDELDPAARAIGSVNTLVRRDGKLMGYNTDVIGFRQTADRAGIRFEGKKVLVLGSGGASLTAQYAAREGKAREVVVVSRSGPDNYENLDRHADAEILVNTTPVGMWPNVEASPVDLRRLPGVTGVIDVIYNPARTSLLLQAEERGRQAAGEAIRWTGGLRMLVAQAVAAEEIFFGRPIPGQETGRVLAQLRLDMENIVLVGMPGCGKSTVGQRLAALSGKPLVDLDEQIVQKAGKPIPAIFAQEGEGAFRALEREVLAETAARSGQIVATGGGAVLRPENRSALRRSGRVYFLRRELASLPREGRPLSQTGDLERMYRDRLPLYQMAADRSIDNDSTPETAAEAVWRDFREHSGE